MVRVAAGRFYTNYLIAYFSGVITRKGVYAPLTPDVYEPIIELLEKEGIGCKEEIVDA